MKNKKLHLINDLLWEFDNYRLSIDDLDLLLKKVSTIKNNYPKDYVFYKILDFLEIEIIFTIESELSKSDEVLQ